MGRGASSGYTPGRRNEALAPFEEAVGIYRALVKANLPARPGDLARAASQVLMGSSRLMRPWWQIRRRCELFGPLDQFTATYGRYLRAVLADRLQILTQLGGHDQELDDCEAGLGRLTSTQQGVQRRPGLSPTGNVNVDTRRLLLEPEADVHYLFPQDLPGELPDQGPLNGRLATRDRDS